MHRGKTDTLAGSMRIGAHAAPQLILDVGRKAGAIVLDPNDAAGLLAPDPQPDRAVAIARGVVEQVAEQLVEVAGIDAQPQLREVVDIEAKALVGVDLGQRAGQALDHRFHRNRLGQRASPGRSGLAQLHIGDLLHQFELLAQQPALVWRQAAILGVAAHHCHRRLEAMRKVAERVPVARLLVALIADHGIEALDQRFQFGGIGAADL